MEEFFKALQGIQFNKPKQYFIKVEGENITYVGEEAKDGIKISVRDWHRLNDHGKEHFIFVNGQLKARKKSTVNVYPLLVESEQGYTFEDNNPFWVNNTNNKRYSWQIK